MLNPDLNADPSIKTNFARGIGLPDFWDPDQLVASESVLKRIKGDYVEWVNLKPPLRMEGANNSEEQPEYTRGELIRHIEQIHKAGFKVFLQPQINSLNLPNEGDIAEWEQWFAKYLI